MKFTVLLKFDERSKDYFETNRIIKMNGARILRLDEITKVTDRDKEIKYYAMRFKGSLPSFVKHFKEYSRNATIYPSWN